MRRPEPHRMSSANGMRTSQACASVTIMANLHGELHGEPFPRCRVSSLTWNFYPRYGTRRSGAVKRRREDCGPGRVAERKAEPRADVTQHVARPQRRRRGPPGGGRRRPRRARRAGADAGAGAAGSHRRLRSGRCASSTSPSSPASQGHGVTACSRRWWSARLLQVDPRTQTYRLGVRLFEMAHRVWNEFDLRGAAEPELERLCEMTGEAVRLAILQGREILYIDQREAVQAIRLANGVGGRASAYATSAGKALLAHLDPAMRHRVLGDAGPPALHPQHHHRSRTRWSASSISPRRAATRSPSRSRRLASTPSPRPCWTIGRGRSGRSACSVPPSGCRSTVSTRSAAT